MYAHANSSTVYNGHKEETAQRSTNSWMGEQNVVSPYSRVLLIQRNEVLVPATTWMNFENVTLRARSQTQRSHLVRFRLHEIPGIGKPTETECETDGCQGLAEGKQGAAASRV